jgi:DNA-binding transcriptional regulator YhcF (GntR family)
VFSQLIGQIRDGVSSGELRPGMALPTIRAYSGPS